MGGPVSDQLDLDDIQGLVARGYGRLPHAAYILLRIDEPTSARQLLDGLVDVGSVTTAAASTPQRALNVAFTSAGLTRLTESTTLPEGFSEPYLSGMVTDYRSRLLGDIGANAPTAWEWGGPTNDAVDAVLFLFAPDQGQLGEWHDSLVADLGSHGFHVVKSLTTAKLSNREPFGFRDGISQPVIAGLGRTDRDGDVVKDGEFVLGYVNEYGQRTERPMVPAGSDPHRILPRDPDGSGSADLGLNGSYLVFRQLAQDLTGFEAYLDRAATVSGRIDPQAREWLAAKLVGRWRGSGAPLTLAPEHDDPAYEAANGFSFHALDQDGLRCPVGAHIRRANPRDSLAPDPGTPASRDVNRRHRLLRRGRAYGAGEHAADGEHGLHFQCLNTNLARQYEFVQHSWLNDPGFAGLAGVEDPVVGPRVSGPGTFDVPARPVRRRYEGLPQFVSVRGGAYLFLPGVRALRFLASTTGPG
jgi:Dyp-type peroxidase family